MGNKILFESSRLLGKRWIDDNAGSMDSRLYFVPGLDGWEDAMPNILHMQPSIMIIPAYFLPESSYLKVFCIS